MTRGNARNSAGAGTPASCSSAMCSPPSSAAAFAPRAARSMPCCAASTRCRGGACRSPTRCSAASAAHLLSPTARRRAAIIVFRTPLFGAGLDRRRTASYREALWRCRPISVLQKRPCGRCIAPALRTTISPRNRTGSMPIAAPSSPTSSSPLVSAAGGSCSVSPATRTCAISSSTSAATRPPRSLRPNAACWREKP